MPCMPLCALNTLLMNSLYTPMCSDNPIDKCPEYSIDECPVCPIDKCPEYTIDECPVCPIDKCPTPLMNARCPYVPYIPY